nr:MAG TPA: hypothetical protein [Caudoviricetes sp.]
MERDVIFWDGGWLSDYRTSLSLKGERLFHTKNTRLFDDGSQENATTIPETVTTIPAGTLRLLLSLISYRAKARKEIRQ